MYSSLCTLCTLCVTCINIYSHQYHRTTCDETGGISYSYSGNTECNEDTRNTEPDYQIFTDQCVVLDTYLFVIDINSVMGACVQDGVPVGV